MSPTTMQGRFIAIHLGRRPRCLGSYAGCDNGCGTDFIKFDAAGNLYVSDFQPIGRVRLISSAGVDLGDFVTSGILQGVEGLGFDVSGNL